MTQSGSECVRVRSGKELPAAMPPRRVIRDDGALSLWAGDRGDTVSALANGPVMRVPIPHPRSLDGVRFMRTAEPQARAALPRGSSGALPIGNSQNIMLRQRPNGMCLLRNFREGA